ncbi:TIGR00730 family Rossman fold protein [Corynebacterium sp. Q4381]|uniref:TIGR00730 family Rossman fold protein n=1 Tax=Corynebacterium sp. Marseille-Q4381 TaxID=3121597 RepID=UPI002FE5C15E
MINVAAVVIRNARGEVLCVRKKTSPRFQLPGGKPEEGESVVDTALRETLEETGLELDRLSLGYLGRFSAPASNEPGHTVTSTVFTAPEPADAPAPAAEIAEVAWIDPAAPGEVELAPLLATQVFPALAPRQLRAVAVFAGARPGTDPATSRLAFAFGEALGRAGITLVYGGSKLGLMGEVARGAHLQNGRTCGVLTTHLAGYELKYDELDQLEVVDTMAQRKARMGELADAFVVLPGGVGTLDELFDEWTNQQLGLHAKPIGLLGEQFWRPMAEMVDHMVDHGFVRATDRDHLLVEDSPETMLESMRTWVPPVPRWI